MPNELPRSLGSPSRTLISTPVHIGVLYARTGSGCPAGEDRLSKDIAATPYRLNVMISAGRPGEFFAQVANKDIDDLELGFLYPP